VETGFPQGKREALCPEIVLKQEDERV